MPTGITIQAMNAKNAHKFHWFHLRRTFLSPIFAAGPRRSMFRASARQISNCIYSYIFDRPDPNLTNACPCAGKLRRTAAGRKITSIEVTVRPCHNDMQAAEH
jgi:hypothetical protein